MVSVPDSLPTLRRDGECPLTRSEEKKAVDLFQNLMPVLQHPRCLNCHGGVDPFVPRAQGKHLGGQQVRGTNLNARIARCQKCHGELPGWDIPVEGFFFTNKTAYDLCVLFKATSATGDLFVGHVDRENGSGPLFTRTAFIGDRALTNFGIVAAEEATGRPFTRQPPPGTKEEFVRHAREWADAIGEGWKVAPDCGCIPVGSAWVGTVKTTWERRTKELGTETATANATVRFEIDSSFDVTDDPAEYWKSVSGTLNWVASNVGGECHYAASGSVPIVKGSDDNPMVSLRGEHYPKGGMKFSASLGPWPEKYEPLITWDCPEHDIQTRDLGVYYWWGYDIPTGLISSPDGKILKGKFQSSSGPATSTSEWDLHLEP